MESRGPNLSHSPAPFVSKEVAHASMYRDALFCLGHGKPAPRTSISELVYLHLWHAKEAMHAWKQCAPIKGELA